MKIVSKEYAQSMKQPLRNRGYINVTLGVIKQDAQRNAKLYLEHDYWNYLTLSPLSYINKLFSSGKSGKHDTATYEKNFVTVTGDMHFASHYKLSFEENGMVTDRLVGDKPIEVNIESKVPEFELKGATLDFGYNYPVDFDITAGKTTLKVRGNNKRIFKTEQVFEEVKYGIVTITFIHMRYPENRARLYNFLYGYGLVLNNSNVLDSVFTSYTSPIQQDLPQQDFKITIDNQNGYFNVDNPKSAVNFLEHGQEMTLSYGYDVDRKGNIEWINKAKLAVTSWKSDNKRAIITAVDILRNKTANFAGGTKVGEPQKVITLLQKMLRTADIKDYYIDEELYNIVTTNPTPELPVKQAMQLVANMARAVMLFDFDKGLMFKCNFEPKITYASGAAEPYSDINLLKDKRTDWTEYACFARNFTGVGGNVNFRPKDNAQDVKKGFVTKISDSNGSGLETDITISLDRPFQYYNLHLDFSENLPKIVKLESGKNKPLVFTDNQVTKHMIIELDFNEIKTLKISFVGTKEPYGRIVVKSLFLGDVSNFRVERGDMMSYPLAEKQERIKEIQVPYFVPQKTKQYSRTTCYEGTAVCRYLLENPTGEVDKCWVYTSFKLDEETYYDFEAEVNGNKIPYWGELDSNDSKQVTSYVETQEKQRAIFSKWSNGNYVLIYDVFKFLPPNLRNKEHSFTITGKKVSLIEIPYILDKLAPQGKTIKWKNPLISNEETSQKVADWIKNYYQNTINYEFKTRGNPEIECNDFIYQDNEWHERMRVNVYKEEIRFSGAFRGTLYTKYIKKE